MRTLIVGAGAVGGYFGARLVRAGNDVTLTARGEHLRALQSGGLRFQGIGGEFTVAALRAVESPRGEGPFELVLVCVKLQDTERALADLWGELSPGALVLSLQNGVESEPLIERLLGIDPANPEARGAPMIRALAYVGAELVAPGVINHTSGGTIMMGEIDDRRSQRLDRLEKTFTEAEIRVIVPPSILRAKWQKLAWNASFNLVCALTGTTIGGALALAEGKRLIEAAMREVEAVARAQGIEFDEGHVARDLRRAEKTLGFVRPSTLQDREKGKPLEHDALTGAVVRFGKRYGVPTPVNETLDALARLLSGTLTPP